MLLFPFFFFKYYAKSRNRRCDCGCVSRMTSQGSRGGGPPIRSVLESMSLCGRSVWVVLNLLVAVAVAAAADDKPPYACDRTNPGTRDYVFCDISRPIKERVEDLISRLSLEEKVGQLSDGSSGVERLGIPKFEWWSEALHGVGKGGKGIRFNGTVRAATSFPQVILTAASFNVSLWYHIAQATGIEARAVYNAGQALGLTFWAPNINIFRDPRWGRGQETPGEDPLVCSKYGVAFVRGFQGERAFGFGSSRNGNNILRASACCKHYTAYDLENWEGHLRYTFDAVVSKQDLLDTYQPPFKSCVEDGHASGVMCSYNRLNGVPTCADYDLLSKTARGDWGFQGYITSDCDAVSIIHDEQGYAPTPEDAVADVLKAGMDLNCGDYLQRYAVSAIRKGKIQESHVDRAFFNSFSVLMRLGLFDGDPRQQPYGNLQREDICSAEHQNLALEAARQGIVLLKNRGQHLPLSKTRIRSLAVIGPNAHAPDTLLGNYEGVPCKTITPLQGLRKYVSTTLYSPGCENVACSSDSLIGKAVQAAKTADAVVLVVGLDQTQEKEEQDRVNLVLPGEQQKLVYEVSRVSKTPVVLVILSGGPVDVSFAVDDPLISSILWAGYPGEAGGQAVAEVIFGDYNPGGRLPVTWYPQEFVKIPMTDMNMRPNSSSGYPGRTYRFYTGKKVFEFGDGLSYSRYSYEFSWCTINEIALNVNATTSEGVSALLQDRIPSKGNDYVEESDTACEKLKFRCHILVRNHGTMDGTHVVLLYSRPPATVRGAPRKQLVGFQRVLVQAKSHARIGFVVDPCKHLSTVDEKGRRVLAVGSHSLIAGDAEFPVALTTMAQVEAQ